jgi:Zn-finger protein
MKKQLAQTKRHLDQANAKVEVLAGIVQESRASLEPPASSEPPAATALSEQPAASSSSNQHAAAALPVQSAAAAVPKSFAAPGPRAVSGSPTLPRHSSGQSAFNCTFCKPGYPCAESRLGVYTTKIRRNGSNLVIFHWSAPNAHDKAHAITVFQETEKQLTKQFDDSFRGLTLSREPVTMLPRLPEESNHCSAEEYTTIYNSKDTDEARIAALQSLVMPSLEQFKLESEVFKLYMILSSQRTNEDFAIVDANQERLAKTANAHQSFAVHCVDSIKLVNARQTASNGAIMGRMRS